MAINLINATPLTIWLMRNSASELGQRIGMQEIDTASELRQRRGMQEIVCYLGDEYMHTKLFVIVNGEGGFYFL